MNITRSLSLRVLFRLLPVCLVVAAATVVAAPAWAQNETVVNGTLLDADGQPAVGHRVVFRAKADPSIFITAPTGEGGEFSIGLPTGQQFIPFSVLLSNGRRIEIKQTGAFVAQPGVVQQIRLPQLAAQLDSGVAGSERLFLGYAEDAIVAEQIHAEGQLEWFDTGTTDALLARLLMTFQFDKLPNVEFGGRVGFGSGKVPGFGNESGATDLDLWAKLQLPGGGGGLPQIIVGGIVTAPTGSTDAGLSTDQLRSKLFASARFDLPRGAISAHAGVRFNGTAKLSGMEFDGKTAATAGVGLLMPLVEEVSLVAELGYEGERYEGAQTDLRVLLGFDWRPALEGAVRLAVAVGLDDGAPDTQILVGYAFDF